MKVDSDLISWFLLIVLVVISVGSVMLTVNNRNHEMRDHYMELCIDGNQIACNIVKNVFEKEKNND